jgi:hypothetical protein
MTIDWAALGTVLGVSVGVTVALVGLFTLGIMALSTRPGPAPATGAATGGSAAAGPTALARTAAYGCFALCAAAVAYGFYLIVV